MTKYLMMRLPAVLSATGLGKTKLYEQIAAGLFPHGVRIGEKIVAWPDVEVYEINAARVAGKSDDDVRALVTRLESNRKNALAGVA